MKTPDKAKQNIMEEQKPRILIFNVAAASVQDSYEANASIAEWLHVPIERVHEALAVGNVSSLHEEADPTLDQMAANIAYVESAEQRKLAELVREDGYRPYILVHVDQYYDARLLAFYALVAAYSQSLPNILCMQITPGGVPAYEVRAEIDLATFLAKQGISSTFHPCQEPET